MISLPGLMRTLLRHVRFTVYAATAPDASCTRKTTGPENSGGEDLGEGAKGLEAAGDGGGEAFLAAERSEDEAVLGAVGLVGAMRAAKLLDGFVRAPGQFVRQMHSLPLIQRSPERGMPHSPSALAHKVITGAHVIQPPPVMASKTGVGPCADVGAAAVQRGKARDVFASSAGTDVAACVERHCAAT